MEVSKWIAIGLVVLAGCGGGSPEDAAEKECLSADEVAGRVDEIAGGFEADEAEVERKQQEIREVRARACKDDSSSDPQPTSYRAQVADCVEEVGFVTRAAGNALRVESPGGNLIANIQTFPSRSEARQFNSDVEVPHTGGGRGAAVWLRDSGDTQRRVVADCLIP
jgi:hypothetical protein